MPAIVTDDCRVYYGYNVQELTRGQVIPDGEFAIYLLTTGAPVVEQTDTTGDVTGDGVPDGTAKDVLDWVGSDQGRAARALEAERGRDKPRSTLIADLERLSGGGGS